METVISGLGNRVFLMNNVHDDRPTVFESRWAMSYLRGPLTLAEIKRVTPRDKGAAATAPAAPGAPTRASSGGWRAG